jgi:hypothetical protein
MLTDALWGATLAELAFDVRTQTVLLQIVALRAGIESRHELKLADVSSFHFVNTVEGPWNYVELTELHFMRSDLTDRWHFDIMMWLDDTAISGSCAVVTLDGVELTTGA